MGRLSFTQSIYCLVLASVHQAHLKRIGYLLQRTTAGTASVSGPSTPQTLECWRWLIHSRHAEMGDSEYTSHWTGLCAEGETPASNSLPGATGGFRRVLGTE